MSFTTQCSDLPIMTTISTAKAAETASTKKAVKTTATSEPLFQFNPATMVNEKVGTKETGSKTVYEDGSYSETLSNGAVRNYDANGKWVSGIDSKGHKYSYTYDDEKGQITCNYDDGTIDLLDKDYKTTMTITPGEEGVDDDGKHYQMYSTSIGSSSKIETKMYDDGSFIRNTYKMNSAQKIATYDDNGNLINYKEVPASNTLEYTVTQDADGAYTKAYANGNVENYSADDVELSGTLNGVSYTNTYGENGKLTQRSYDNGNLRVYNEDGSQVLYDENDKWIGGTRSELSGEYTVTYNEDGSCIAQGPEYVSSMVGTTVYLESPYIVYDAEGRPTSGKEQRGCTWEKTYNEDGSVKTEYSSGEYYVTDADGKVQSGRVAGGSEYTLEYNEDGSYVATYKDGVVATYDAEGNYVSHTVNEVEKMSYKEANKWINQYKKDHNCDGATANRNFEQIFGYETPKNIFQKAGKFFKKVGDVLADVGIGALNVLAYATHDAAMRMAVAPPPPLHQPQRAQINHQNQASQARRRH